MFTLSFNSSFDKGTNFTDLFGRIPRLAGGDASLLAPQYVDGTMFCNDYSLLTYGYAEILPILHYVVFLPRACALGASLLNHSKLPQTRQSMDMTPINMVR